MATNHYSHRFTGTSGSMGLVAATLSLLAGVGLVGGTIQWVVRFEVGFETIHFLFILAGLLAFASAAFGYLGRVDLAPWFLIPGVLLALLGHLSWSFLLWIWPWSLFQMVPDSLDRNGPLFTALAVLSDLSPWLMSGAFILAIIAFGTRHSSPDPQPNGPVKTPTERSEQAVEVISEGWYPDPEGKPSERYWDGSGWTEETRPQTNLTQGVAAYERPTMTASGLPISSKSRAAAAVLCWFLGVLGIHRFYVGKIGTGVAQIFTLGGLGVWALIDFVMILVGNFKDGEDKVILNW